MTSSRQPSPPLAGIVPAPFPETLPTARRRRAPWLWSVPAVAAAALANVPLVYLFVRSFEGGLARYLEVVMTPTTLRLVWQTLALVGGVVVVTVAIALPLAWLVVRTDLPGRKLWAVVGALPLVFPSYVSAYTLVAALGPRGYLQSWLAPFGVEQLPAIAYGYSGALLALGLFVYPYTYLLLVAGLRGQDPSLEESSRSLGAGRWGTFFRVALPPLQPALYGGSLLVVLYTLSDLGAVSVTRYNTFTLSIYNAYRGLLDRATAASLASVLVLLTLAFILFEAWLMRRDRPSRQRPARPQEPVALGRWRWPCVGGLALLSLFTVGMPAGVVGYWGVRALAVGNPLGPVLEQAMSSVSVSVLAAGAAVVLSVPIAAWSVRYPNRLSRATERLTFAGYALPGIVVGLALVFMTIRFGGLLYQSLVLLVVAYVIRFLPEAVAATRGAMLAVAPAFEEAGRSLGRSAFGVLRSVTLPMVRPGLLAGGGLVFLTAMKELPATLILRPIGFDTLATRIWSAASEGIYSQASLPALCLLLVTAVPLYLLMIRPVLEERS